MTEFAKLPPHPKDKEIRTFPEGWQRDLMDNINWTYREWRELLRCPGCGTEKWDPDTDEHINDTDVVCEHGCCVMIRCDNCNYSNSGWGPVGCECEDEN